MVADFSFTVEHLEKNTGVLTVWTLVMEAILIYIVYLGKGTYFRLYVFVTSKRKANFLPFFT